MNVEKLSGIVQTNSVLFACIVKNLDTALKERVKRDFKSQAEEAISHFLTTASSDEAIDAMRAQLGQITKLLDLV